MTAGGQEGTASGDARALFADASKRWLLIAGSGLAASSGAPQPHRRTRWSPRLADVVTYQLFRTQNRQVFEALERSADAEAPPLGFVGDTLEAQAKWLDDYLAAHEPHTPLIRAADLAKAGVFQAVATNAPDRLLNEAFDALKVDYKQVSLEDPHLDSGGPLPLLREWDARVFKDSQDRRTRESAFIRGQLDELLDKVDGVLVVGHSQQSSDLMETVKRAVGSRPNMHVVWVDDESEAPTDDASVTGWLEQNHDGFLHIRGGNRASGSDDVGAFLDMIAGARGVVTTPVVRGQSPAPLLTRTMNKSFDVRPALVFVPGVALLGGLIDRLPRISVKMIISIFALIVAVVAYINWDIWAEYRDQVNPVKAHLAAATKLLSETDSYEGAIRAEAELNDAARKAERLVLPYDSVFSISLVHRDINRDFETTKLAIQSIRDLRVTPMLYRNRFRNDVESDPSRLSLANHPPLLARPGMGEDSKDPRGVRLRGKELSSYRLPRQLSTYADKARLAMFSASAPLLRVTMQESMLRDLQAGRLAIEVDLSRSPNLPLENQIYASIKRVAGYVGKRQSLYSADGITELLNQGKGAFYFFHLEASGTARSLNRIRELLVRFPKNRAIITAYSQKARKRIAQSAPEFDLVTLAKFSNGAAMSYLRKQTSAEFVRRLMQNHYLRTNVGDPLVLSLLVDFYKFTGTVPRSLALVYDRLLQSMLSRGKYTYASKFPVLRALARHIAQTKNNLTRERASGLVAATLFKSLKHDGAAAVLDELVANGVLRYRDDTFVDFMDPNFYALSLAKQLRTVSAAERKRLLIADGGQLAAFYAGMYPNVDALIAELTSDFFAVDRVLRSKQLHLRRVNPYAVNLTSAALLAHNGTPSAAVVARLEATLFEMVNHKVPEVVQDAFSALRALSSAGARRWVLVGLSENKPYDEKLLQYTASAPETTYVDAIERWLTQVGTDADPRRKKRYNWNPNRSGPNGEWSLKRGALKGRTIWAIRHGIHTLAQLGTPRALALIDQFAAQPDGVKRFGKKLWDGLRRSIVSYMLWTGRNDRVRRFYKEISADPAAWALVIPQLYRLNDKATARLLVDVIAKPDVFKSNTSKYKLLAATTLALVDRSLAAPLLNKYLTAKPAKRTTDYRPYAAASLAYRGDARDFPMVQRLVGEARANPLKDLRARRFTRDYVNVLNHAVAVFGSKQAFTLFSQLSADASWRKRAPGLDGQWSPLRAVGGPRAAMVRLMCHSKDREQARLMDQLGFMRSDEARGYLLAVVRMLEGQDDLVLLGKLCGKRRDGAVARLAKWRTHALPDLVRALAADPRPQDLSLYAKWAMHPSRKVRRAALYALHGYPAPAAGKAIAESLTAYELDSKDKKTLLGTGVYLMGRQGSMANESVLLRWLKRGDVDKTTLTIALGRCGGLPSLLELLATTPPKGYSGNLTRAIHLIAHRVRGRTLATAKTIARTSLLAAVLDRVSKAEPPPPTTPATQDRRQP